MSKLTIDLRALHRHFYHGKPPHSRWPAGRESTFRKNILTHAQARRIIASCAENLESNHGYLYLGLILMLTTGITINELCALTWGSFSFSNTYTGVVAIEISAEAKSAGEVYRTEELNGPRRRTIPLSPTMAKLYHKVKTNAPNVQENAPFMRSFKTRHGGCAPTSLIGG